MIKTSAFLICIAIFTACTPVQQPANSPTTNKNPAEVARAAEPQANTSSNEVKTSTSNAACVTVNTGNKAVLKSQTFAIDFEPFKGSCFVTTHDPEYKDPPLESEIAIYRDGKRVFEFPEQFNGIQVGCWVEAVAFQDVNNDRLTDVIVVGKCSGKTDSFNENSVYINNGRGFVTNIDANYKLADLKTIRDIAGFARENLRLFSPTDNASDSNRQP